MNEFRKQFVFPNLPVANWYPGHMAKGVKSISRKLQHCDCVIEVHDARIPFTGRNPHFHSLLRGRPKILVLNKVDLSDQSKSKQVFRELQKQGEKEILFSNMRKQHHRSIRELMTMMKQITGHLRDSDRALQLMVVGMPNVGKSSLINALRRNYMKKGRATAVGKLAGVTRSVLFKIRVCERPEMFLFDTPGVMMPNISSEEVALKLALTGILKEHIMDDYLIADYLLFTLNKHELYEYAEFYGLPRPIDDIHTVLNHIAQRLGALQKGGSFDIQRAAQHFILKYRNGDFGRITLDPVNCLSSSVETCSNHTNVSDNDIIAIN